MEMIPAFYFDKAQLMRRARALREQFRHAHPYSHAVIDDFLPDDVIRRLIDEFPGRDDSSAAWEVHGPGRTARSKTPGGDKRATSDETTFPPFIRHFMMQLNSATFVAFLQELTGINGLIVDPGFGGCGLHSTGNGGRLMIHTDVNRHTVRNKSIHQRLNAILYLNEDWKEEYGGALELYDESRQPQAAILPIANRLLVFSTGTKSYHGHPKAISAPEGRRRNSLAAYYYIVDRPVDADYEGFQNGVNWVATNEADFAFQREESIRLLARLDAAKGRTLRFPTAQIPENLLPRTMLSRFNESVPMLFFDWEEIADKPAFMAAHLRAAASDGSAARLAKLRPFGLVGVTAAHEMLDARAATMLVEPNEGKIYICHGPASSDLVWIGYGDALLPILDVYLP